MLQRWNEFCFTGGTSKVRAVCRLVCVQLTLSAVLWPGVWQRANLGRLGFGASMDELWPYCVWTLASLPSTLTISHRYDVPIP
ncbi:glycoside hydrolase family 16 protein [Ramaria rubella]|nr:glycoside hydrolase family 16 protein [Ramaria rubella]